MATAVATELPGNVWRVLVKPGDRVKAGDVLFVLEVMKTEVPHLAPCDGTIGTVDILEGQEGVDAGVPAVTID